MKKGKTNPYGWLLRAGRERINDFTKHLLFFPAFLFSAVLVLGFLQINGSSIGIYHQLFYGDTKTDENLLFNNPRAIRSDEWLVTTPLTLSQTSTHFSPVNQTIGDGIDVSLLVDAPAADPIQLFRPHNLAFYIAPEGIAFSLKWWLLAYLLVVSVYFFVITLLPGRRKLAILLSLCFLASPFIQWWYQYITLAPIYYTLFGIVVAVKLLHVRNTKAAIGWGVLLAYITTSFVLTLYPPFQIPCVLFAIAVLLGYILDNKDTIRQRLQPVLLGGGFAVVLTVLLIAICLVPKLPVIETITSTAYPGKRITESGGFNVTLFFANNTSLLSQSDGRASAFAWLPNQSEGANFMLVFLLLLPLVAYFVVRYRKKLPSFWISVMLLALTLLLMAWLFVPGIDAVGKVTLLNRVLHERLLIGFGLINLLSVILLIPILEEKRFKLPCFTPILYAVGILAVYIAIDLYIAALYPGFMGQKWALLLALPYPFILYLFLKRRFILAVSALLLFSVASVMFIHPLYRGVSVLQDSELSKAVKTVDTTNSKRWVTDTIQLENYAALNGKRSLSGVYVYPDINLWKNYFNPRDTDKYNRYAHVHFRFDRNAALKINRQLDQPSADQLVPVMEPCDNFLKARNAGYLMTTSSLTYEQAPCATILRQVSTPRAIVYIYKLEF